MPSETMLPVAVSSGTATKFSQTMYAVRRRLATTT
jgi:hypothetical protein